LKSTKARKSCENKNFKKTTTGPRFFLVEGRSIEGSITKVVEWIEMNVGLLILHKAKVLIL